MLHIKGLTEKEAQIRLEKYGPNEIKKYKTISPFKIFLGQFTSPLILLLIGAAIISVIIRFLPNQDSDIVDTILIIIIVLASGISGFFQEYKAEKSIESLQKMSAPKTRVIRDGQAKEIPSSQVVVGDIILLEGGDIIPADAKLIEASSLMVDESALTGESESVVKKPNDEIYMNTFVYVGNGKAEVQKTGMQTKIGEIANKLQEIKSDKTSFEKEIDKFSKKIFWIISAITIIILLVALLRYSLFNALLTAISLAVAAIPEGLPAIVALALAIGAKTMVRKKALIRKLGVTESIGAIDIICTDKTGTLTQNNMTVSRLFINNKIIKADEITPETIKVIQPLIQSGLICNNVRINTVDKKHTYLGMQTEIGLVSFAEKLGFSKDSLDKRFHRLTEQPFTSERKMMSVVVRDEKNKKHLLYAKGAPEKIIEKCSQIYQNGKILPLSKEVKKEILEQNKKFASSALRVLASAYRQAKDGKDEAEKNLILLGLEAMIDPPRPEVKQAIQECYQAKIRVIMITGDNATTAQAIAQEIGLKSQGVITGQEVDKMSDKKLRESLDKGANIFARTTPFHKLRILKILGKNSRVAMTGDGVNDSLALKQSNVGIAMGLRGTETAKNASDMILLDDNFKTIVSAIKEGRKIFDNIRKFINYLLVSNFAEVAVLFIATVFINLKEPILFPVQILWINLLTDGMPALALGVDPARPNIMSEPPRRKNEPIINKQLGWLIGTIGTKKSIILLITFFILLPAGLNIARTALFTGFILYEFVRIGSIRSQEKIGWLSNKWLVASLLLSIALQLIIIYTPLNTFFHITPLGITSWLVLISGVIIGYALAIIITKLIIKHVKE